jgi:hypothetical protein
MFTIKIYFITNLMIFSWYNKCQFFHIGLVKLEIFNFSGNKNFVFLGMERVNSLDCVIKTDHNSIYHRIQNLYLIYQCDRIA